MHSFKRSRPEGHAQHRAHTFSGTSKTSGPGAAWVAANAGNARIGRIVNVPRAMAQLAHLAQREIKYVDNAYSGLLFHLSSTPPVAVYIGGPVQGAAPYQRIGSKIVNKSLHIRGIVNPQTTGTNNIGRLLLVYDRQCDGAAPTWATVIQGTTAAGVTSNTTFDGLNMSNRMRFKVLMDEQFYLPSQTYTAGVVTNVSQFDTTGNTGAAKWNFERYIRLPEGLQTHFSATAGGVGDVATGGMFLFASCEGVDAAWNFAYGVRLRFDDL